jgi:hypothetical protein
LDRTPRLPFSSNYQGYFPKGEYVTPGYEELFRLRRIKIASKQTSEYSIRAAANRVRVALYLEFREVACESFPAASIGAGARGIATNITPVVNEPGRAKQ